MCKVCKTVLCSVIIIGVLGGAASLYKWHYDTVARLEKFIGKKVRIKFNGKVGVISDTPDMRFTNRWPVRLADGDWLHLNGGEMVLLEEADDDE